MAVQIIPLVAAIVGGAVTIGAGVYVYNNYQNSQQKETETAVVEPQKLLQKQEQQVAKVNKPKLPFFTLKIKMENGLNRLITVIQEVRGLVSIMARIMAGCIVGMFLIMWLI